MRIGELAGAVGVSTSAIRYYEKVGLLDDASRSSSGYRDYSEDDERRLRLVVQARMLSIPLSEVREIVGLAFDGRCVPARAELSSAVNRRLADTRRQIRELRSLQRELERMSAQLADEDRASRTPTGSASGSCTCLDGLTSSHRAERKRSHDDDPEGGGQMSDEREEMEQPTACESAEPKSCGCGCMGAAEAKAEEPEATE